ncbi:hypothetical protein GUITHDRAFT_148224 [Guillardia theta CCMP2712]|uniref:Guanylate kinase-like domain-containing protein n=1 Tax=Guillardia theta (strain CCMP2712) TaxID=905079 RepID=L1IB02_GUITC|nr:hypothetical protein GUITHDRAFT_148224 [Guillardia theta CCMP2712]EKX33025.1 hypothetical protein GUITHDRAFT_148224 [Guillardia theta CCMP2712]|eukprot:XP_005820005.1 hypothetical protein GUITHDRAFT_148224 [Guillardia theta CCMP2712]
MAFLFGGGDYGDPQAAKEALEELVKERESLQNEAKELEQGLARVREGLFPSPLVISGPPSVGKATLISMILREFQSEFSVPIAHTSRTPNEDECDGEDYIFISREEMQDGIKKGMFLEVAEIDGDLYGTAMQVIWCMFPGLFTPDLFVKSKDC